MERGVACIGPLCPKSDLATTDHDSGLHLGIEYSIIKIVVEGYCQRASTNNVDAFLRMVKVIYGTVF